MIAREKVDWPLLRLSQRPRLPATRTEFGRGGEFKGKADGRMPPKGRVGLDEQEIDQGGLL